MSNAVYYDLGGYQSGEKELIITDGLYKATRRCIIFPPGHTGNAFGYGPGLASVGGSFEHVRALAEAGYACFSIDGGGSATWGGQALVTAVGHAVDHALALYGGTKVGIYHYSMGGLTLNYVKRNPSKVAGCFFLDPVLDLDYVHNTSGYTPSYSLLPGSTAPSGWAAEAETDYSTNAAGWAAATVGWNPFNEPASYRALVPMRFAHATDDHTVSVNGTTAFVAAVNDPQVTMRTGTLTGDHSGVFANMPASEIVAFFDSVTF